MIFRSVSNEASGCMSSKVGSTIGFERRFNPALRRHDREGFVRALTESIPPRPPSMDRIIAKDREGQRLGRDDRLGPGGTADHSGPTGVRPRPSRMAVNNP
jgi:hypothetical protein